jgi:hypothetical protein
MNMVGQLRLHKEATVMTSMGGKLMADQLERPFTRKL